MSYSYNKKFVKNAQTLRKNMTAEEKSLLKVQVVNGRIAMKIEHIGEVIERGDLMEKLCRLFLDRVFLLIFVFRHSHEEDACFGLNFPEAADDLAIVARKRRGVLGVVIQIDVGGCADLHEVVAKIVDTEGDDISLAGKGRIPEIVFLGKGFADQ